MDYRRKKALIPELVLETFARLQAVLDKYEIQIFDMYNVDEIGFRIGCIASSTVIIHKNIREVYVKDLAKRESIIVMECILAGGFAIKAFIIMPCKVFKEKMFDNNLPDGTKIAQSETGYTDDELAISWLWHFHY